MKILLKISILSLLLMLNCQAEKSFDQRSIPVSKILGDRSDENFARAIAVIKFQFPRDLGMHPQFRNEWWYFTGNLTAENGERFGYQFTIFRSGLSRDSVHSIDCWRANQIFMAHFAVSNLEKDKFYFSQRFSRAAAGLAGADIDPFKVWLEDWRVEETAQGKFELPVLSLRAQEEEYSLELTLESIKPVVLQGKSGLSRKGEEEGNASYYYSFTRLKTAGNLQIQGRKFYVTGFSWMDREWSTSALGKNEVGWDWFSLQFEDGTELMYYQIRDKNGLPSKFSEGTFVREDGSYQKIETNDVELIISEYWQSPLGSSYPSKWIMKIDKLDLELEIVPAMKNQEINGVVRYWEGSVIIDGKKNGVQIKGRGYVELTGYDSHKAISLAR